MRVKTKNRVSVVSWLIFAKYFYSLVNFRKNREIFMQNWSIFVANVLIKNDHPAYLQTVLMSISVCVEVLLYSLLYIEKVLIILCQLLPI